MKFGIRDEVFENIKFIANSYNYNFYIFGSRAKECFRNNSDIDIAVFGEVTEEDEYKIRDDFDKLNIEYEIDLVFEKKISSKDLLENIKKEGVLIK